MVTFNELCFSEDVQSLSIDCSVEEGEGIEKIYVEYYKNRNTSGAPSDKALLVWEKPVPPEPEPEPEPEPTSDPEPEENSEDSETETTLETESETNESEGAGEEENDGENEEGEGVEGESDTEEEKYTEVKVTVDASQLSVSKNGVDSFEGGAFYILVHWKDADDDDHYDMGLLLDWSYVYKLGMDSIAKFVHGCSKVHCEVPEYFEQMVLVIHALQLAIETKDIDMIDTLWSRFISFSPMNSVSSCNCR